MAVEASHLVSTRPGRANMHPESRLADSVGPIQGVTEGASSILNDAFDLAELQSRLLLADTKECLLKAKLAALGLVVTLGILIAALPVVANGLAQLLAWVADWPLWACQLGVGVAFTAIGLGIGFWCIKRLRTSITAFESTRLEAAENIRWLRSALSRSVAT